MDAEALIHIGIALLLAPLFLGVVNRTKAVFAGRQGRPLLQAYFDLAKLLRKGAVYSRTTTWVFRAGPVIGLSAVLMSLTLLPFGGQGALISFKGDFVLFAYLLGLARFSTVMAAMDVGSSFEGMGASREVTFSALAEPVLFLCFLALARHTGVFSFSEMLPAISYSTWTHAGPALVLVASALFLVTLAENSRIPIDDPNTHLELTMIHEVMVLDHGGPDFAFIQYGSALKLWAFSALVVGTLLPIGGIDLPTGVVLSTAGTFILAVMVGAVESTMARLRLLRVPQYMAGAAAFAVFALVIAL